MYRVKYILQAFKHKSSKCKCFNLPTSSPCMLGKHDNYHPVCYVNLTITSLYVTQTWRWKCMLRKWVKAHPAPGMFRKHDNDHPVSYAIMKMITLYATQTWRWSSCMLHKHDMMPFILRKNDDNHPVCYVNMTIITLYVRLTRQWSPCMLRKHYDKRPVCNTNMNMRMYVKQIRWWSPGVLHKHDNDYTVCYAISTMITLYVTGTWKWSPCM